jgi:hypothetical protein
MHKIAVEKGWITSDVKMQKWEVRQQVRRLPDGFRKWERLQGIVYGPLSREAELIHGVQAFFQLCKRKGFKAYIVSQKTLHARYDETHTNLRDAALSWMKNHGVFEPNGFGLTQEDVYFEATRTDKLERLNRLGCTHVIDDLEETFLENKYPECTVKILYAPYGAHSSLPGVKIISSWKEISDYVFDGIG